VPRPAEVFVPQVVGLQWPEEELMGAPALALGRPARKRAVLGRPVLEALAPLDPLEPGCPARTRVVLGRPVLEVLEPLRPLVELADLIEKLLGQEVGRMMGCTRPDNDKVAELDTGREGAEVDNGREGPEVDWDGQTGTG